jgi:predicted Zn-dependent protease
MLGGRLVIALVVAGIALGSYYFSTEENPITGEAQRVGMSADQEVALGLQSAPQMIQEFGGEHPSAEFQRQVDGIGAELLAALQTDLQARGRTIPYPFEFHLLADDRTINAFALPGGQVFITYGLFKEFTSPAQLAGVLGHEIGHVLARHSAQQLAKQQLTQGLAGAAGVAGGTYDSARMAQVVASMVNMKFGRDDELEADKWGIKLMGGANYDPRAMIEVMEILDRSGGGGGPEFLSTHPKPANRIEYIQQVIADVYPQGVPDGMRR